MGELLKAACPEYPPTIPDPPSAQSEALDFFVLIFRCKGEVSSSAGREMFVDFGIFSISFHRLAAFEAPPVK
jgi:hypothetical protein